MLYECKVTRVWVTRFSVRLIVINILVGKRDIVQVWRMDLEANHTGCASQEDRKV